MSNSTRVTEPRTEHVRRGDPHRPRYHFLPPANWMNDPNGLIHWRGRYHLFYQHNPTGAYWSTMHWGHAVSDDLVHWEHLPIALEPTPGGPDEDGCFSGCAFDHNGVPTIMYTGVHGQTQLPCLATSDDDDLITWTKYPGNPVIAGPPNDADYLIFRDHTLWNEAGTWYQAIGSGIRGQGGTALLYRSENLIDWTYLHPLAIGDKDATDPVWTGMAWECPDFFALGNRYALIASAWDGHEPHATFYCVGDYADHRFTPRVTGELDAGGHFYAPQKLIDAQGRRIMFGWLREARSGDEQIEAGWSGVMSLPRVLGLTADGDLAVSPAEEVDALRGEAAHIAGQQIAPGDRESLSGLAGDGVEIDATFTTGDATRFGLRVRCSPSGEEYTEIVYDTQLERLIIDGTHSSLNPGASGEVHSTPLSLSGGELHLRVYLDRSVLEVFANDRVCISDRIYPRRPDSEGIEIFAEGGAARLLYLTAWQMAEVMS